MIRLRSKVLLVLFTLLLTGVWVSHEAIHSDPGESHSQCSLCITGTSTTNPEVFPEQLLPVPPAAEFVVTPGSDPFYSKIPIIGNCPLRGPPRSFTLA